METSVLGGCVWTDGSWGQGESGLGSSITVGSLSSSRFTTYGEQMHAHTHTHPLYLIDVSVYLQLFDGAYL